jgi:hypothetical protein
VWREGKDGDKGGREAKERFRRYWKKVNATPRLTGTFAQEHNHWGFELMKTGVLN